MPVTIPSTTFCLAPQSNAIFFMCFSAISNVPFPGMTVTYIRSTSEHVPGMAVTYIRSTSVDVPATIVGHVFEGKLPHERYC